VAVDGDGKTAYSTDGINRTNAGYSLGYGGYDFKIASGNGKFVMVSNGNPIFGKNSAKFAFSYCESF
jgi:hypothetical protein